MLAGYPRSGEAELAESQMDLVQDIGGRKGAVSLSQAVTPTSGFRLVQNYPNPFNPMTVIGYDLPVDGQVSLKVYDILGREALTLFEGFGKAGYHEVTLDASDLASGLYFYRLTAGSFTDVKKLVVVK